MVVAEVGGLRHLVTPGENGLFFPSGDAAALVGSLEKMLRAPTLRAALGAAGRQLARERYSWEKVADETERIYQAAETRGREVS